MDKDYEKEIKERVEHLSSTLQEKGFPQHTRGLLVCMYQEIVISLFLEILNNGNARGDYIYIPPEAEFNYLKNAFLEQAASIDKHIEKMKRTKSETKYE